MSAPHLWPSQPVLPSSPEVADEALRLAVGLWPGLVLASSLGPSSIVVLHLLERLGLRVPVFVLDTGLLFAETVVLKDRIEQRFSLTIETVRPRLSLLEQESRHGPALWERDPSGCCRLRKVDPLAEVLAGQDAWITGLRKDQGPARGALETIGWDERHGIVKVSPLAHWTRDRVFAHLRHHDLPYNPLLDLGYPSVGCRPCTRPSAGDDERAGRWADSNKTECGIHLPLEVTR